MVVVRDHAQQLGFVGHAQDDGDGADDSGAGFSGGMDRLCKSNSDGQVTSNDDVVDLLWGNALRVAVNR